MFTGIIQAVGAIQSMEPRGGDVRLTIATASLPMQGTQLGDSIAVNGVCLTAIDLGDRHFSADVSRETLNCTSLGKLSVKSPVNLEMALRLSDRLGGHLVSGHVDGLGQVVDKHNDGRSVRFSLRAPQALARYIAPKGSICINGISLTVNSVQGTEFDVNIVPHTQEVTTLGTTQVGDEVNLEVDLLARYLERLMLSEQDPQQASSLLDRLRDSGFIDN